MEIKTNTRLKQICAQAINAKIFHPCVVDTIENIKNDEYSIVIRDRINAKYANVDQGILKQEFLKFLLFYINTILNDGVLTNDELANLKLLKMIFKIKQGDFYQNNKDDIQVLLNKQLQIIYSDKKVDEKEAIYSVSLQELFDLSYDQFEELSGDEIRQAIKRGANPDDLDTILKI